MKTVLIVEDDVVMGALIQNYLEAKGFHSQVAHSGESGVQMSQEALPDLVLCDCAIARY